MGKGKKAGKRLNKKQMTLLSEDIDNTSHDASVLCIRPFYYLNHGSVTILGILQLALWNEDARYRRA